MIFENIDFHNVDEITNENGEDVFVHYSGINMEGFKELENGANVTYELVKTERGVAATNVVVIGE